ncbi:hypothetical protein PG985_009224 [Apiospora marii]|uniref:uncharacterized protein n=1 Tax=Apiospora marii TaxID=335849 RepID=UPI00312FDFFC
MIIGIVFTALYLGQNYAIISWVGSKEEDNETQVPADVTALNESHRYDVDQKRDDFVISENPADSTMCPDELHGCQSFDIRVSTSSGPSPLPRLPLDNLPMMGFKQDICCASPMFCYRTDLSDSGIYCCDNATKTCEPGPTKPAVCAPGLTQCNLEQGGGCCPNKTDCSSYGCLQYDIPSATQSGLLPEDTAEAAATPNATTYKIGEIALSSSTSSSSSRATLHPISCTTKPQAAHISTFVAVFIMIRRLFLG